MSYVIGALAGIAWGGAVGFLNAKLMRYFVSKNSNTMMMVSTWVKTLVDVAALAVVFLLRKSLPFQLSTCLIGTAITLSMVTMYSAFKLAKETK